MKASVAARAARCLLAAIPLLAGSAAPGRSQQTVNLVVSFPPERLLVRKADLPIEGFVRTAGVDEVEIVVNDARPVRADVEDRVFVAEVELDDGLNVVRIGPETRTVWLDDGRQKPPAGYGHIGLSDGCLECHEVDEEGAFTLAGDPEEICLWCHGDMVRGRPGKPWASVHAPVRNGRCLSCHMPHISGKKGLPSARPPACADCHEELDLDALPAAPAAVPPPLPPRTAPVATGVTMRRPPACSASRRGISAPRATRPSCGAPGGRAGPCRTSQSRRASVASATGRTLRTSADC